MDKGIGPSYGTGVNTRLLYNIIRMSKCHVCGHESDYVNRVPATPYHTATIVTTEEVEIS